MICRRVAGGLTSYMVCVDMVIIIMKSSFNRDNNYCHYVIQRIAGFAITLYYHPAGLDVVIVVYRLLDDLLIFFSVWVGGLGW
jgi:hypothetical protein